VNVGSSAVVNNCAIRDNGGSGVYVLRGAYALIDGNTIVGNNGNGISIEGASATVTNNTIANSRKGITVINSGNVRIGLTEAVQPGPNTIENNSFEGIQITNGGAAFIFGNTIRNNGLSTQRPGVTIHHATGELIGGNTIQGNAGHGVVVNQGALFQGKGDWNLTPGPDLITGNGYSGISGWNGASLDIWHVTVTNNTQNGIVLSLRSTLRIYDSTVSNHPLHGVAVYDGSAAAFYHPTGTQAVSITGNTGWGVFCGGGESSYTGDTSGVTGNTSGDVSCSGF
jgi:parallel beta-helix repeat protein